MCTLEKRGNIFFLTLTGNTEHRLNPTLLVEIRTALSKVRSEAQPGSVLITTAQGKFFSNGLDLAWAQLAGSGSGNETEGDRIHLIVDNFRSVVADIISLPLPTIAAVTGHAAAAGFVLALCHDYVLMRKDRGVLYMSEIDIGMTFSDFFMAILRSKIASPQARRDAVLWGAKLKAEEAVEMGIIDSAHNGAEATVEAALRFGEKLGARKWHGEVYAEIRKASYPEVCNALGLVEKVVLVARL